jgi:propanol-preferring alcohol dehydrogenase
MATIDMSEEAAGRMRAMVLRALRTQLVQEERSQPLPGPGEIRLRVEACAVCRTDLHIVDGDLRHPKLPLIPGHEIVGRVDRIGPGVTGFALDERVGVPWLGQTCGCCSYCKEERENLCDTPVFTGYTRDGGFATHAVANAAFSIKLGSFDDPVSAAPLLCAGLIGWRSLVAAGERSHRIGIYGFGAAAHIITQVCVRQGRQVFAFTRRGDQMAQDFARELGAVWAGDSEQMPPGPLDAAIIFAPVGSLVPAALEAVRKGGRVVCGGIHMSDIPSFPYCLLWEERQVVSVANLTRVDAASFFAFASTADLHTETVEYELAHANEALADLRAGRLRGAAVLVPTFTGSPAMTD